MGFTTKIIKIMTSLGHENTGIEKIAKGFATDSIKKVTKPILTFAQEECRAVSSGKQGIVKFRVKPDITIPINTKTIDLKNPLFPIKWNSLKDGNELHMGELGNVSLRLAQKYKNAEKSAAEEIRGIFDGYKVSVRAKGANSVYSKLERMMIKGEKTVKTDNDAFQIIQDAIGGRISLKNLTQKDIQETLNSIKFDGKLLTSKEKEIITRFFKNEKLTKEELQIAKKYSKGIKINLAEKQSDPVFRKFILSGLKDALNKKLTTFEKLEKTGIRKDIIEELKTNPNIKPGIIGEVNNYKGRNGIPYFSDRQIREFEKFQLATGQKFDIITCSENIDLEKYGLKNLPKSAQDAIKPSGYTTAQVNMILSDGNLAEIQIRGEGPFGEYEHLAYDSKKGKNTLGEVFQGYKKEVQGLKDKEYDRYNDNYISPCYDYYRDAELGIISTKPKLPSEFNPILSEENMQRLHLANEKDQAEKMKTFVPHIEYSKTKTFLG